MEGVVGLVPVSARSDPLNLKQTRHGDGRSGLIFGADTKRRSYLLVDSQSAIVPGIEMMFSVFRFAFLVASTFSLVLCIPQIFNGIPNITPFDVASLPSPSVQDHYKSVGSPANGLTGLSGGDSGGATFTGSTQEHPIQKAISG